MAYSFLLKNAEETLSAEVCPVHGGMITQITLEGKPILHMDRGTLETAPMAAGGMPLLFPFPSKTKDDVYRMDGRTYYMPMHGLVKNAAFAVKEVTENTAKLWIGTNPAWAEQCYPFDFYLEVTYRLEGNTLYTTVSVTNRSASPMPHYLGWHPFFLSTDKKNIFLDQSMTVHYDYGACVDHPMEGTPDLSTWLDDVFHSPEDHSFRLTDPADGYEVGCRFSDAFDAMVVCSWVRESMCVEPWCGLPDSINQNRFLQWIAPGETAEYHMDLTLRSI